MGSNRFIKKLKTLNLRRLRPYLSLLIFLGIFALSSWQSLIAQNHQLPLNYQFRHQLEGSILQTDEPFHSAFLPLSESQLEKIAPQLMAVPNSYPIFQPKGLPWWRRKLFHEHLFILDTQKVYLTLDPIYHFEYGSSEAEERTLFKNSRGFLLSLQIGDNFAVGSTFRENQVQLPEYIAQRVDASGVAYGQGRVKRLGEGNYDFAMSSSYLSYNPVEQLNITVGHGKHFIGQGYRSHLLSDLAFNYPYLRLNSSWFKDKVQYQNLFALYQDLERIPSNQQAEELFERKLSATHFLSYSLNKDLVLGLFESNIWPQLDSNGNRDLGVSPYLPVIFLNSFLDQKEKPLSSLVGLDLKFTPARQWMFYGQLASRELNKGLTSYQLGAKYYTKSGFRFGLEYNQNTSDSSLAYTHYNESLNLPYGGEVKEWVLSVELQQGRMMIQMRVNLYRGDLEQDFLMVETAYLVNPAINSAVYLRARRRNPMNDMAINPEGQTIISFGWRTYLQNLYFNY